MNKCRTCAKEKLCEKEERENCKDYKKQPYSTIEKDEKTGIIKIKPI